MIFQRAYPHEPGINKKPSRREPGGFFEIQRLFFHLLVCGNPHRIKRAIDEDQRHQEEGRADEGLQLLVFHRRLGDLLIESSAITPNELVLALKAQRKTKALLGRILVGAGKITEDQLQSSLKRLIN